ncbi:TolC family protein [Formosa sediminum]|uniref:TolC family protein n=1 Tax=Formosa sediminum TaxID=2594004 RepID=A0A516GS86_9FLAO|nr:TolC family protein [Formosa sediminum]QDO94391.1 TolC family protein [Formosa sediminum]
MLLKSNSCHFKYTYLVYGVFIACFSCAPKFSEIPLPIEDVQSFSTTGEAALNDKWWLAFEDEQLNVLIDSAMQRNFDLAATWQQFVAAQATVAQAVSNKWPQIEARAQTAENFPLNDFTGGENTQVGLSAAYEIDIWGRIGTAVQAEKFNAQASLYDYRAAALSLSAEIATTWYQIIAAKKQLDLTAYQIKTNEDIISLMRSRFVGGQIRSVDLLRQAQLLESTREQHIIYQTNLQVLQHQLAVLLGKQPQGAYTFNTDHFPELPALPETGLSLELVRRRPDLQQSYAVLLSADRAMAAAVRNKYPRISIQIDGQLRSNNFANLFENWAYSLAGNILAPLFYGGQLQAEVDAAEAIKQQRLYEYGQATLVAFQEVEDGLTQDLMQLQRTENIKRQLALSQKSNAQLRIEFLNGYSPYLDILIGLNQEQQLRRDYIDAQLRQILMRINLYRALAGSFDTGRTLED